MEENFMEEVAAQLRKPTGEFGIEVAYKMNESNLQMNLTTIHTLKIKGGDSVLEIGMGNGFFAKDVLSKANNIRYIGCDYSQDMIDQATSINKQNIDSNKVSIYLAEAQHLPVKDSSINVLFTVNTLYFWEDKIEILNEIKRVLSSNGQLVIAIRPERCLKEYPSTRFNFEYFTTENVTELLTNNGFKVDKVIHEKEPEVEILQKFITPEFSIISATVLK